MGAVCTGRCKGADATVSAGNERFPLNFKRSPTGRGMEGPPPPASSTPRLYPGRRCQLAPAALSLARVEENERRQQRKDDDRGDHRARAMPRKAGAWRRRT